MPGSIGLSIMSVFFNFFNGRCLHQEKEVQMKVFRLFIIELTHLNRSHKNLVALLFRSKVLPGEQSCFMFGSTHS